MWSLDRGRWPKTDRTGRGLPRAVDREITMGEGGAKGSTVKGGGVVLCVLCAVHHAVDAVLLRRRYSFPAKWKETDDTMRCNREEGDLMQPASDVKSNREKKKGAGRRDVDVIPEKQKSEGELDDVAGGGECVSVRESEGEQRFVWGWSGRHFYFFRICQYIASTAREVRIPYRDGSTYQIPRYLGKVR